MLLMLPDNTSHLNWYPTKSGAMRPKCRHHTWCQFASERGRVGEAREDPHFVQMIILCREVQALHQQGWRRLQQEEALLASVTLGARIKVPSPALPCPLPEDKYPRRVSKSSACSQDLQLQSCVGGQKLAQAVLARHTSLQRGH